jgi:WD40 repeat protein
MNDPTAAQAQQAVLTLEGHTGNVTAIGFQRDGRYLYSGSEDGTIKSKSEKKREGERQVLLFCCHYPAIYIKISLYGYTDTTTFCFFL